MNNVRESVIQIEPRQAVPVQIREHDSNHENITVTDDIQVEPLYTAVTAKYYIQPFLFCTCVNLIDYHSMCIPVSVSYAGQWSLRYANNLRRGGGDFAIIFTSAAFLCNNAAWIP